MKHSVKKLFLTACAVMVLGSCTVEGSITQMIGEVSRLAISDKDSGN